LVIRELFDLAVVLEGVDREGGSGAVVSGSGMWEGSTLGVFPCLLLRPLPLVEDVALLPLAEVPEGIDLARPLGFGPTPDVPAESR
jgi:hypothetical protein